MLFPQPRQSRAERSGVAKPREAPLTRGYAETSRARLPPKHMRPREARRRARISGATVSHGQLSRVRTLIAFYSFLPAGAARRRTGTSDNVCSDRRELDCSIGHKSGAKGQNATLSDVSSVRGARLLFIYGLSGSVAAAAAPWQGPREVEGVGSRGAGLCFNRATPGPA
jgi:hypothetical protein